MANSKQNTPLCFWKSINSIQTRIWNFATNLEISFLFAASVNCYLGEDDADAHELWVAFHYRGVNCTLAWHSEAWRFLPLCFCCFKKVKAWCKVDKWSGIKERSLSFLLLLQHQSPENRSCGKVLVQRWVIPAVRLGQVLSDRARWSRGTAGESILG